MSIELDVALIQPVSLRQVLPKASEALAEMLGLSLKPELRLEVLEQGQRRSIVSDELRDESSPQFLISIAGEPETVALIVPGTRVSVSIAHQRTSLEYALGAAVAIALARELGGLIEDDWRFFGVQIQVSPDELLARLKVVGGGRAYREAADKLEGRLGREARTINKEGGTAG